MKSISIRQPWAWLIVNGYKDIENRNWKFPPSYRETLLIHASKTFDYDGYEWVKETFPEIPMPSPGKHITHNVPEVYDRGGFVGTARLSDVVEFDDSPWFFGEYGFKIRMAKPIPFIPYKGQLGLFDVPQSIINQIQHEQITK